MISIEILNKLSIQELGSLQNEVDVVLKKKRALISNCIQFSDVSERCKKVLEENNIETWRQLASNYREQELRLLRNCGSKTLLEILNELDQRGLKLKGGR